jgi:membrane fusion protein, heavy metal efflux system
MTLMRFTRLRAFRFMWLRAFRPAVFTVVAALALASCGRSAAPEQAPAAPRTGDAPTQAPADRNTVAVDPGMLRDLRVTFDEVEARSGSEEISLLGELAVDQRAYAEVAAPVTARVTRLLTQEGDGVRAGQLLAEVTSPELGRLRAEYVSADARTRLAEAALERKQGLAAERIVPLREVQEAESAAAEARAARRAAAAAIGAFGVDPPRDEADGATSSSFVLRAPISGAVIAREAVVGQMLEPSTVAFRIGNLSTLWLTVHAFERDAVRIDSGVKARVVFPALPGETFQGAVTMVGREVDVDSRTVSVRIDVRNSNNRLKPGMSAKAALPVGAATDSILSVPAAAVQRVHDEWCVFLPKGESAFEIRRIGRGRDLGDEVEVLSGLKAGERIVVDGAFLLKAQAENSDADHEGH